MNIIAVDDERAALRQLDRVVSKVMPKGTITCFTSPTEALEHAKRHPVDVAFLDIAMPEISGLFLAKKLKDQQGQINIIFVTGFHQYAQDAFALRASGYVMKPIDPQRVEQELANLRNPVKESDAGLRIQCFGNFEVFFHGVPVFFRRPKSKEALAYLVDRKGASVSKKELAAILFEDEAYSRSIQSHVHIIIAEISAALIEAGAPDIVIRRRGTYRVETAFLSCDYYDYENGKAAAVNRYHGEYMSNYSWGEFRIGTFQT